MICRSIRSDGVIGDAPVRAIEFAVTRLAEEVTDGELCDLLAPDVTFVPCPGSAPFPPRQQPVLWVPRRICEALRDAGFGAAILPCLERVEAVQKSAFAGRGGRPSPQQHFDSMTVMRPIDRPERITLVDDVVTKGAPLPSAASLVKNAFPKAEVRAFALVRTMGLVPDVDRIVDPVVGRITRNPWGEADREP